MSALVCVCVCVCVSASLGRFDFLKCFDLRHAGVYYIEPKRI